ncbi:heme exporter protein CcmB [Rhodoflexus caldus]|uniref:heme exporter protein CcmB n=1 Tax=Rhodoflexus caldus TaxID=2891236 RepID=UPI00202A6046|nr:heme exporter protein CcmB [Rhodoflexus caldus]
MIMREILILLGKELRLEWRRKYAFNGILLYIVATVFVAYLSFNLKKSQLSPLTWNALFWIILLFTAISAIAKSFVQEPESRHYYYYQLVRPESVIISKILYNSLLMVVMSVIGLLIYVILLGNPVQDMSFFLLDVALGSMGFAAALTLVSAIAAKAQSSGTLMAVLGFPVVLPMIMLLIKVSKNAIDGLARSQSHDELLMLGGINLIVLAVSFLLFPFLWKA